VWNQTLNLFSGSENISEMKTIEEANNASRKSDLIDVCVYQKMVGKFVKTTLDRKIQT
jgi:hypothetical protein